MLKVMHKVSFAVAAVATVAALTLAGPSQAGPMDKPVAARQSVMKLYGFYMGQLGSMAKGKMAYDAKQAQGAAEGLLALSVLDTSKMWLPGSGVDKLGDKTRAKPEIWSTYPEVAGKGKALTMALEGMVKVAGGGLDGLRGGIGAVGKACGSCHKAFRVKKD